MKMSVSLIYIVLLTQTGIAQNQFGISLDLGISGVSGRLSNYSNSYGNRKISPSGSVGFFYSKSIGTSSAITTGLQFSQYTGREKTSKYYTYTDTKIKNVVWKNLSCIELPIEYTYSLKKYNFSIGIRSTYIFKSTAREIGYSTFAGSVLVWDDELEVTTRQFNIGPSVGFGYSVSEKINLRANYYIGLLDIYSNDKYGLAKIQQFSFGIAYSFTNKN